MIKFRPLGKLVRYRTFEATTPPPDLELTLASNAWLEVRIAKQWFARIQIIFYNLHFFEGQSTAPDQDYCQISIFEYLQIFYIMNSFPSVKGLPNSKFTIHISLSEVIHAQIQEISGLYDIHFQQ